MALNSSQPVNILKGNDTFNGFMILRPNTSIAFERWLDRQRAITYLVLKRRLIRDEDINPLRLFGRLPFEIREMIYEKHLNVGYIIPCKTPYPGRIVCFGPNPYSLPSTGFLCSSWKANQEANRYLYGNNTIVLQGQDSEGLDEFLWNLRIETADITQKFYI